MWCSNKAPLHPRISAQPGVVAGGGELDCWSFPQSNRTAPPHLYSWGVWSVECVMSFVLIQSITTVTSSLSYSLPSQPETEGAIKESSSPGCWAHKRWVLSSYVPSTIRIKMLRPCCEIDVTSHSTYSHFYEFNEDLHVYSPVYSSKSQF